LPCLLKTPKDAFSDLSTPPMCLSVMDAGSSATAALDFASNVTVTAEPWIFYAAVAFQKRSSEPFSVLNDRTSATPSG
jgi:hypothetical protein